MKEVALTSCFQQVRAAVGLKVPSGFLLLSCSSGIVLILA